MLTETAVSPLLTASIIGAGLIIAIYALITPISKKFDDRVKLLRAKKKEFERLKKLASEIKKIKTFPKYLGIGVVFVFICYLACTYLCVSWLALSNGRETYEFWIALSFLIATIGFSFVGIDAVSDVYWAMKGEFEQVKKEKEEVKKESEKLVYLEI